MSRWLAGAVVLGGGAAPAPPLAAWGASPIRVAKKNARCAGRWELCPKAWPGWMSSVHCSREGQGDKSRCFTTVHKPCRMHKKKPTAAHVARVAIARLPALTPQRRYRRSLVSKGHFDVCMYQRDLRRNRSSPSAKAISRGDRLFRRPFQPPRARQAAGCFVGHDGCTNFGNERAVCGLPWLLRVIDHETVHMPGGAWD
jgi:hypothetical protein